MPVVYHESTIPSGKATLTASQLPGRTPKKLPIKSKSLSKEMIGSKIIRTMSDYSIE